MSDQPVEPVNNINDEHANVETEPTLSKSAKKRAKKQQKKASESADDQPGTEKIDGETSDGPKETTDEKTVDKVVPKKKDPVEMLVPMIKKFDVNGKPVRTIAGHGSVYLGEITPHNILQLKKLNEAVFPIAYNDKFYVEARTCGDLGRLAYYNDVVVGAVCCRIDDISDEKSLYLMTLGTLAAYRQCGIGTHLIYYALKLCKKMEEIKTMYLHVQVNNQTAVQFYERHGFTNDGIIEDYYRISPRDAYLLIKRIRM
ncbi:hypothetical protein GCK72_024058 [Caenorhabditis remanei]|uniref:N-terminal methionine N(alpha)-acetyltransferase NatE n=1 Tax=Caenorhabditis remanei TaxID=31234 RepID=A0A6A5FYG5_CAERE|nr:hypothetical protein GCK72_024058 [Caenorhabditis remanei]KAF1747593.1 hypothetical protein GCK72_024058 [Caenorhabditis remanei]